MVGVKGDCSSAAVMDTIHLRTKEPLTYTGFTSGIQEMLAQRERDDDCRIVPRGAAETLETARRRSPFGGFVAPLRASSPPPPRQNSSKSRSSGGSLCSRLDITLCHVSIFILCSVPPPHPRSAHQKKGQTGTTHQENGVPSSLMPVVGSGFSSQRSHKSS